MKKSLVIITAVLFSLSAFAADTDDASSATNHKAKHKHHKNMHKTAQKNVSKTDADAS